MYIHVKRTSSIYVQLILHMIINAICQVFKERVSSVRRAVDNSIRKKNTLIRGCVIVWFVLIILDIYTYFGFVAYTRLFNIRFDRPIYI